MKTKNAVFEKTYYDYIARIAKIDLCATGRILGLDLVDQELVIPFLGDSFKLSGRGIRNSAGQRPGFDRCVILAKYVLLCPETLPDSKEWAAFRDLKNSGPLEKYFRNDVEMAIIRFFSGKLSLLKKAVKMLGGRTPAIELNYDLAAEFVLLPMLPVIITFNDEDDEFPASCSVLFEAHAESFLDAESLAMLANVFAMTLKRLAI